MIPGTHKAHTGSVTPVGMVCQHRISLERMLYRLMQRLNSMVVIPEDSSRQFLFGNWADQERCPLAGLVLNINMTLSALMYGN